jgi:hypothetical protein
LPGGWIPDTIGEPRHDMKTPTLFLFLCVLALSGFAQGKTRIVLRSLFC